MCFFYVKLRLITALSLDNHYCRQLKYVNNIYNVTKFFLEWEHIYIVFKMLLLAIEHHIRDSSSFNMFTEQGHVLIIKATISS